MPNILKCRPSIVCVKMNINTAMTAQTMSDIMLKNIIARARLRLSDRSFFRLSTMAAARPATGSDMSNMYAQYFIAVKGFVRRFAWTAEREQAASFRPVTRFSRRTRRRKSCRL